MNIPGTCCIFYANKYFGFGFDYLTHGFGNIKRYLTKSKEKGFAKVLFPSLKHNVLILSELFLYTFFPPKQLCNTINSFLKMC